MPCKSLAIAILFSFFSLSIFAQDNNSDASADDTGGFFSNPGPKSERNYISFGLSLNEFSKMSVDLVLSGDVEINSEFQRASTIRQSFSGLTAQTYGASLIFGNYIDDTFKTEFRYGRGIQKDILEDSKGIMLNHWMSMLVGADQVITDYMTGYALVGISYYQADITRYETNRIVSIDGINRRVDVQPSIYGTPRGLFKTNFSMTWLLGLDYKLSDQWYLSFEYGRLLKDTDTDIEVDQYSTYLKFEF